MRETDTAVGEVHICATPLIHTATLNPRKRGPMLMTGRGESAGRALRISTMQEALTQTSRQCLGKFYRLPDLQIGIDVHPTSFAKVSTE